MFKHEPKFGMFFAYNFTKIVQSVYITNQK